MYKTRNTGTGDGMRGTRGMGSGWRGDVLFRRMSPNIPENVPKHSEECPQTFRGMSPEIPGNVAKYSGICLQTFRGMTPSNPGNVFKYSGECPKTFRGISPNYYH